MDWRSEQTDAKQTYRLILFLGFSKEPEKVGNWRVIEEERGNKKYVWNGILPYYSY